MSEAVEEEGRLDEREGEDAVREGGGRPASRVRRRAEVETGDVSEAIGAHLALYPEPRGRRAARVRVGGPPIPVGRHRVHDLEQGLRLRRCHPALLESSVLIYERIICRENQYEEEENRERPEERRG